MGDLPGGLPIPETPILFFTGKGGVGKTSLACALAVRLADGGRRVLLVSTDPASNLDEVLGTHLANEARPVTGVPGLSALNIDPEAAARDYRERVVGPYRHLLPVATVARMEEQLSGACTTEIAAFDEFTTLLGSDTTWVDWDHVVFDTAPTGHTLRLLSLPAAVAMGSEGFVVLDTAPTGHTLLLLDAAEAYHREVARTTSDVPDEVRQLLPRLRDPSFTRILLVTLPEATPVHEAAQLQADLRRAGIEPFAWVVNQTFAITPTRDPVLQQRAALEAPHRQEVRERLATRVACVPWSPEAPVGRDRLLHLTRLDEGQGAVSEERPFGLARC